MQKDSVLVLLTGGKGMSICHFWYFALYKIGMCKGEREGGEKDGEKTYHPIILMQTNSFLRTIGRGRL
jgi:hypothetical protein